MWRASPISTLSTISLFTGVGGLDFGFEAAGFKTVAAVEADPAACHTIRANRDWPIIEDDIHRVRSEDILQRAGLRPGEPDVLIGGPPCQPFSKSGYWIRGDAARLDDPRADTLAAYLRVLRGTLPKAFLLENVCGFAYRQKDEGLRYIMDGVNNINRCLGTQYSLTWGRINAVKYGVPQRRERVFVVGARDGRVFRMPDPTHEDPRKRTMTSAKAAYRTVWDAIGDLPKCSDDDGLSVGGKWADLLPTIPEGSNYLWHTARGGGYPLFGWRTRYWNFLLKLAKNQPSWTIQAYPGSAIGPFHWENRKLSTKEMCRIQTFPDGLHFACGRTHVQRLLGNAVPSLLGEIMAREIRRQLFHDNEDHGSLLLLPPARTPVPGPEPVREVRRRCHWLIGDHAVHPGEGRGPGALKRMPSVRLGGAA